MFHERLTRAMARAGYLRSKPGRARKGERTQAELARLVGMNATELTRWVKGERSGLEETTRQLAGLARELDVPLRWLLEGPEEYPVMQEPVMAVAEPTAVARLEAELKGLRAVVNHIALQREPPPPEVNSPASTRKPNGKHRRR